MLNLKYTVMKFLKNLFGSKNKKTKKIFPGDPNAPSGLIFPGKFDNFGNPIIEEKKTILFNNLSTNDFKKNTSGYWYLQIKNLLVYVIQKANITLYTSNHYRYKLKVISIIVKDGYFKNSHL